MLRPSDTHERHTRDTLNDCDLVRIETKLADSRTTSSGVLSQTSSCDAGLSRARRS